MPTPHLHIDSTLATWLNGHATPVAGITTDFDGQTRSASTPDIGADEFTGSAPALHRVPSQYATIQSAINASAHGDTVLVSDGTYYENIRFKGKRILVASEYATTSDTSHISNTIIDGSHATNPDSGSVVYFVDGEDTNSVLCGFTITGGTGTASSFAALSNAGNSGRKKIQDRNSSPASANLTLMRVGGGVYCNMAGGRLVRNFIVHNRVVGRLASGGGVAAENAGTSFPYLILERNYISDNIARADSGWAYTGGADVFGYSSRIVGNVFERDTAIGVTYGVGGGASFYGTNANGPFPSGLIQGNVFRGNVVGASSQGGVGAGALVEWTGAVTISENLFEGNVGTSTFGWAQGGGLCVDDQTISGYGRKMIVKNRFLNNRLSRGGGDSHCGGGVLLYKTAATLNANEIADNSVNGNGAGVCTYMSAFRLENNIITRNSTTVHGGGLLIEGALQAGTEQVVVNNTIVGNRAGGYGGGMLTFGNVVSLNNIFWADTSQNGHPEIFVSGGTLGVHYSNVQGGWPSGTGNINADPLFVIPRLDSLQAGSPCINAGRDTLVLAARSDYHKHVRPWPLGGRPDIGVEEYGSFLIDAVNNRQELPQAFTLSQNYPNPFNPVTNIQFSIVNSQLTILKVYDMLGREVATLVNEVKQPGTYGVQFDGSNLASGIYFYRLQAGSFVDVKKLILLR